VLFANCYLKWYISLVKLQSASSSSASMSGGEVSTLLSAYSTEADPSSYEDNYRFIYGFGF